MESDVSDLVVTRIRPEDWAVARSLRLRRLADAPDAFARTYQEESCPRLLWRRLWMLAWTISVSCEAGELGSDM